MTTPHRLVLMRGATRIALDAAQPPVVDEHEQVPFELSLPADGATVLWRIRLGDLLPERPQGIDLGHMVRWERGSWFDSCADKSRCHWKTMLTSMLRLLAPTGGR
jgi:hypothetical protein